MSAENRSNTWAPRFTGQITACTSILVTHTKNIPSIAVSKEQYTVHQGAYNICCSVGLDICYTCGNDLTKVLNFRDFELHINLSNDGTSCLLLYCS